jgi:hypothetical protein
LTTKSGSTIELSIEEARELQQELNGIFGHTDIPAPIIINPVYPLYPRPYYWPIYGTTAHEVICKTDLGTSITYNCEE